jgi:hypothetical protein
MTLTLLIILFRKNLLKKFVNIMIITIIMMNYLTHLVKESNINMSRKMLKKMSQYNILMTLL